MPKRTHSQDQNEVPSKSTKLQNSEVKRNENLTSQSSIPSVSQITVFENKIQENTKEIPSTSTSKDDVAKDDRYTFNYWGDSDKDTAKPIETMYIKIDELTLGTFENQSLIGRICYKSEIKETKYGKVVSFLVMDKINEIALVCFGKIGLQLYKEWQHNRIYSFENFKVQEENPNYPSGSNNNFQLVPNSNFKYKLIDDHTVIPPISFSFKSINEITSMKNNTRVDLIGILVKDYGLESNANNVALRDLSITDNNKGMIIATLWGTAAENFKSYEKHPIVIRKGITGEYQERQKINCTYGTLVWSNPLIPEAVPLLKWFNEINKNIENR